MSKHQTMDETRSQIGAVSLFLLGFLIGFGYYMSAAALFVGTLAGFVMGYQYAREENQKLDLGDG